MVINDFHEMIVMLYKDIFLCFLKRNYVMETTSMNINPESSIAAACRALETSTYDFSENIY